LHVPLYLLPSTVFTTVTRSPSSTWPLTRWPVDGPVLRLTSSQRGVIPVAPNVFDDVRTRRMAADTAAPTSAVAETLRGWRRRTQPARTGSGGVRWANGSRAARPEAARGGTGQASRAHALTPMARWFDRADPFGPHRTAQARGTCERQRAVSSGLSRGWLSTEGA